MNIGNKNVVDYDYINLLNLVKTEGISTTDRTSIGSSIQYFGTTLRFSTKDCFAPFIQCRTFSPKLCFLEWNWMMRGSTDVKELQKHNVHIWDGNSTREFLDSQNLQHIPENTIGKSYGYQFRSFGGVVDQVREVFDSLKNNPTSRRHVISIWNPLDKKDMALEPCFYSYTFVYIDGVLNLEVTSRSNDLLLGKPYNLGFSYFWLLSFSRALGYKMGDIRLNVANAHIYANQLDVVNKLTNYEFPSITTTPTCNLLKPVNIFEDILNLTFEDFEIKNWTKGPALTDKKIQMAV
jgi:thymidylate synthase